MSKIVGVVQSDWAAEEEMVFSQLECDRERFNVSILCSTVGRLKSFQVADIRDDATLSSQSESSNELSGRARGTLGDSVLRA